MNNETLALILSPSDGGVWAPPLDTNDLAVRFEAEGVTQPVAQARYGFNDVWGMAAAYLDEARAQQSIGTSEAKGSRALTDYLKGMAFASPLIVCFVIVLLGKVSLWGGSMSGNQAAAIAIATITSFVLTGGFVQVMGRQAHFYKETRQWSLCSQFCISSVQIGLMALGAGVTIGFLANTYFRWLPLSLFGWCAAFNLSIGAYLMTAAVLYVINGELLLTLATLLGTALVIVLRLKFQQPLLVSQLSGIVAAAGCSFAAALMKFPRTRILRSASAPSRSQLVYLLWPYFVYGCLYYLFLFVDRLIAWSAHAGNSTLPLQFRGPYETSLDICLPIFILQVAWIRAGLVRFYRVVLAQEKLCPLDARAGLRNQLLRFYRRQLWVFGGLFIASALPVFLAASGMPALKSIVIMRVVLFMMAGSFLLTIGLWNIALLFALSQPLYVLASIAVALVCNICTGYLASRFFAYDLAILGFTVGAGVLAFVSGRLCSRLLENADYYYFAATI